MFTQDLAQELDVSARAMDLVTDYARGGIDGDITISNQDARGVMGRLGLGDEKPLRKVGELSGGEKARVVSDTSNTQKSNIMTFTRCELNTNILVPGAINVCSEAEQLAAFGRGKRPTIPMLLFVGTQCVS